MKVTLDTLKALGACAEHKELFARLWPGGVEVTRETCRAATAAGLDLDWFANHALPADARAAYIAATLPAYDTYSRTTASANGTYHKTARNAARAMDAAVLSAPPAYDAYGARQAAGVAYDAAMELATERRNTVRASNTMSNR